MQHIVVLIGQLVYFSALHPLQLTIDDRGKTMRMERMGVAGSNVDGGSVLPPFVSGTPPERDLLAADVSRCSSWFCSYISRLRSDTRLIQSLSLIHI